MTDWLLKHVVALSEISTDQDLRYELVLGPECEKRTLEINTKKSLSIDELDKARYVLASDGGPFVPLQFFRVKVNEQMLLLDITTSENSTKEIYDEETGCLEKLKFDDEGGVESLTSVSDDQIETRNYLFDHTLGIYVLSDYQKHCKGVLVASFDFTTEKHGFGTLDRTNVFRKDYNYICELFELETKDSSLLLY